MKARISLETVFPELSEPIRRMRCTDALFDRICGDFELLTEELAAIEMAEGEIRGALAVQIVDSLSGLAQELSTRLPVDPAKSDPVSVHELLPLLPVPGGDTK